MVDFSVRFGAFQLFYSILFFQFWWFINLPWDRGRSHKKFGPDRFFPFDVYWMQTDRQTDRQTRNTNNICKYSWSFSYSYFFWFYTFCKNQPFLFRFRIYGSMKFKEKYIGWINFLAVLWCVLRVSAKFCFKVYLLSKKVEILETLSPFGLFTEIEVARFILRFENA